MIPAWGITGAAIATLITHVVIQVIMPYMIKDTREIAIEIVQGALLKNVINKEELTMLKSSISNILRRKHL